VTDEPTPVNYEAAPTADLWDREMERLIGSLRPGRNVQDFKQWADEARRQYGHEPYGRLRRAVNLVLTQTDEIPPPSLFAMFMREAARQLEAERRLDVGLLPLDETRREQEEREQYAAAYDRVGPGTEAFEWALCRGIAKARKRRRLREHTPTLDTAAAFRSAQEVVDFGAGVDEPTEVEIRDVYAERRDAGIAVGRSPSATSEQAVRDGGNLSPALRDPARWLRQSGGFKSSREVLEERRASGRLEPRMEEYLLEKIREEEGDGPA
jgi:hypothetical protein